MLVDAGYRFTDSEMILAHWFTLDLPRSGSRSTHCIRSPWRCSLQRWVPSLLRCCWRRFCRWSSYSPFISVHISSYHFLILFSLILNKYHSTSLTSLMSPLFVRFEAAFSAETEIHAGFAVRSRTCGTRSSKSLGRMLNITIFDTTN